MKIRPHLPSSQIVANIRIRFPLVISLLIMLPSLAFGLTFQVNNLGDAGDVTPGDGVCDTDAGTGGAQCSLRAAIEESNAHAGGDVITFMALNQLGGQSGTTTIALAQALPDLSSNITINGPGASNLEVQRIAGGNYSIFKITGAAAVTISGLTIRGGDSRNGGSGGGVLVLDSASLNLNDCVLLDNASAFGGAVASITGGAVNVQRCTLMGNSAIRRGGAVYIANGSVSLSNCTVSGNLVTQVNGIGGLGGGAYVSGGQVKLVSCTVTGNSAELEGGGIYADARLVELASNIIAGNLAAQAGPDLRPQGFGAGYTSDGFNLIGKNDTAELYFPAGNPNANKDIVGTSASPVDPKLDPDGVKDNAGATPTIALQPDSPAIDHGASNTPAGSLMHDQRGVGYLRTIDNPSVPNASGGDGTDIGAFELGAHLLIVSRKTHGGAPFDVDLAVDGTPASECRSGGLTSDYQLVLTFPESVTVGGNPQARVVSGTGLVGSGGTSNGGAVSITGSTVTVPLTNIANAQTLNVTVFGVSNGVDSNTTTVSVPLLLGDTNGDGSVNSADIGLTKSKSGQSVGATNFREDLNVDGSINSADISLVKSKSGTAIP